MVNSEHMYKPAPHEYILAPISSSSSLYIGRQVPVGWPITWKLVPAQFSPVYMFAYSQPAVLVGSAVGTTEGAIDGAATGMLDREETAVGARVGTLGSSPSLKKASDMAVKLTLPT